MSVLLVCAAGLAFILVLAHLLGKSARGVVTLHPKK